LRRSGELEDDRLEVLVQVGDAGDAQRPRHRRRARSSAIVTSAALLPASWR
jgi:hypothetical protein